MIDSVKSFHPETELYAGKEAIAAYNNDGVICLRSVFDQHWLNVIETGIDQYFADMKSEGGAANVKVKHDGDKGSFHYATLMWKQMDAFRKVIFESHAPDLFGSILETEKLNLYYDFLLIKEPGCTKAVTPLAPGSFLLLSQWTPDYQLLDRS